MAAAKVLITADIHPYLQQRFQMFGFEVDVVPEIPRDELLKLIPAYTILIVTTYTLVDKEVINNAPQLKLVGRVGSGMENIDLVYCREKNIICLNSPEGNANAVGEHCLAMLLNLLNNICKADAELKKGIFLREAYRGEELDGKKVGIIGYGHTGSAFSKKLRGFDVEVMVYDKYIVPEVAHINVVSLETIQQQCDVISFHVPYNEETHYYGDISFFASCIKKPIIINTSRGAVLQTTALLAALESRQIGGLCIDVFEDEPINKGRIHALEIYQRLMALDNVVATPHVAGWTVQSKYKLVKVLMDKIEEALVLS